MTSFLYLGVQLLHAQRERPKQVVARLSNANNKRDGHCFA